MNLKIFYMDKIIEIFNFLKIISSSLNFFCPALGIDVHSLSPSDSINAVLASGMGTERSISNDSCTILWFVLFSLSNLSLISF